MIADISYTLKVGATFCGFIPRIVAYNSLVGEVERKPKTEEELMKAVQEHYAFCYETVTRSGEGQLGICTELLKKTNVWNFWWN